MFPSLSSLSIISFSIAVISYLVYLLPSNVEPVLWTYPSKLLKFENQTKVNNILTNARIIHGNFSGVESLAFDRDTGYVYGSCSDGVVREFDKYGIYRNDIFFIGGYLKNNYHNKNNYKDNVIIHDNGFSTETKELYHWCNVEAISHRLAWNKTGKYRAVYYLHFIITNIIIIHHYQSSLRLSSVITLIIIIHHYQSSLSTLPSFITTIHHLHYHHSSFSFITASHY